MSSNRSTTLAGQQVTKSGESSEQRKLTTTDPSSAQTENKIYAASQSGFGGAPQTDNEAKSTINHAAQHASQGAANPASAVIEQTKQIASDAYDKTIQVAADTYDRTMVYGKQNPGQLTLIAFGAGLGVGLLVAAGFSSRSRSSKLIEPAASLLTTIAKQYFR